MTHAKYLGLQRAELVRLEDLLTSINLAIQTRHAMIARGEAMRAIADQRLCIAITERAMMAAA